MLQKSCGECSIEHKKSTVNSTQPWKTYYRWVLSLPDFQRFSSIKYLLCTSVQMWISWKRKYQK